MNGILWPLLKGTLGLRRSLLLGLVSLPICAPAAWADTYAVNTTLDASDALPGDGVCATSGTDCTLRAAVQEANGHPGADTITVPAPQLNSPSPPLPI